MNNSIYDSDRSSQLSNAYSDNESPPQLSSRNHDKYMTYRKPRKESRFIYNNIRKPFIRPSSRSSIQSRMMDHISTAGGGRDTDGFVRRKKDEECLKCMLKIPHKNCESHKYIRVGGGYRHSYYYVRMLLEQIELKKQRDELLRRRLEAISEGNTRAIKTYIRTKSGRLIEKVIYVSEEDFIAINNSLARGEDINKLFQKYLTKDELKNLDSFDKDENVALKTYIRTKSGRLIEKVIYISKKDFDAIQRGDLDSNALLRKRLGLKSGDKLEGWTESKRRTITTKIRTKSGRIIEKIIMISEEDYEKLQKGGNLKDIISKYMKNDQDLDVIDWKKAPKPAMKVVKTFIRTKSGRLVEKTILMTEEEYKEFLNSKGDPNFLKKYLNLKENETIEGWEKSSTVYGGSDDEELVKAKGGQILKDKDGNEYEVVVDPITGKKYKKLVKKADDAVVFRTADGRIITEKDIKKRKNYKEGRRDSKSDSEYSYKSFISAGGTRHVRRKKKNADNTRGDSESYHSSQDEGGKARRRNRRRKLKHGPDSAHSYQSVVSVGGTRRVRRRRKHADGTYSGSESYHSEDSEIFKAAEKTIKEQKNLLKNKAGNDSDDSYFSEVSAGGTRRIMKRKRIRNELGAGVGYGTKIEVDSTGKPIRDKNGKKRRNHDSDSDYSYFSDVSVGGTHYQKRKQKIRDKAGKVIGYKKAEDYSSDSESSYITVSDGKGGKIKVPNPNKKDRKISKVFSDATTDSDIVNELMKNMTEEEKIRYLADRAERAKEREQNRKEKYGAKYQKMKKLHEKYKKLEKQRKFSPVFSDATTDSEIVREKMKNMTEEEKIKYLADREQRATEREQKRKEKYGEKYEEMKNEYEKKKEVYKGKWEKAKKELIEKKLARDKKFAKFAEDDADIDSDGENISGKKKKNIRKGSKDSLLEVIRDKDGNIIKRIKKDKDGNVIEIEYDKDGNVISTKVKKKAGKNDEDDDDGDIFEIGPDGKIRLKAGKTKIDLKNISKDDLLKLGIDPNLSKAEQLRRLKEMFGDNIEVVYNKKKIGTKNAEDYGSDAHTTDLAENSDIDIDTVNPGQRVKIIEKRFGQQLKDHAKIVMEKSNLQEFQSTDEKNSKINFLSTYRLVDPNNLEKYARFFAIEDHDDMDGIINYKGCRTALGNLKRTQVISNLTEKQTDFILMALDINKHTEITFRMFSVIAALGDRMTKLDSYCRDLLEIADLLDIERKLKFYRDLFNMNELSYRDPNYIKLESISIDLKAGGLNDDQQEFVLSKLRPNEILEISFLDFLSYIPLFISYHDNILNNPLDSSNNKYSSHTKRRASIQRDMNPLGYSLSRNTQFYKKNNAVHLQSTRITPHTDDVGGLQITGKVKEKMSKYPVLPKIHSPI